MITQFARQLSTLQDAGLPILRSLRILEEQQKAGNFKRIVGYVADDIEGGSTLSEAFGKYPRAFDRLFVNMVAAGEAGGVLDLILARISDFKEKALRLKGRVKGAMIYPVVVMTAAFGIVLGLMTFVIPTFQGVLQEMVGGKLNPVTTDRAGNQRLDRPSLWLGRSDRDPDRDRLPPSTWYARPGRVGSCWIPSR